MASSKRVYISYHWADQAVALKINSDLKRRGYQTWIDVEQVKEQTGFALGKAAEALANSFLIICLISPGFNNSLNCRRELELARELEALDKDVKLPLLPIILDKTFKVSPWLDFFINGVSLYEPEDYGGIAKKIWSFADANKPASQTEPKPELLFEEVLEWIQKQLTISDQDVDALNKYKVLSDSLCTDAARKHAKELVPHLGKLMFSTPSRNPITIKLIISCLLQIGLDNSQAGVLKPIMDLETSRVALDRIIAMAGISEAWEACASAARDLLFLSSSGPLESGKKKLLISYSWDGKVLAYKMIDFLKLHAANWEIVDTENMAGGGSNLERSTALVASASAVLVIVTHGYENSFACKAELMTAKKWSKPTIFVLPDPSSYAGGSSWLKFAMGADPQYDFSDIETFETKLGEMVRAELVRIEAGSNGRSQQSQPKDDVAPMPKSIIGGLLMTGLNVRKNIPIVTKKDARSWLEQLGIPETSSLAVKFDEENVDGECLRALATMRVMELKTFLDGFRDGEVLRLKAGLDALFFENPSRPDAL